MQTLDAIKKRRSVRSYASRKIPKDLINKIIEAGKSAPSAGGLRTQRFFLVENEDERKRLAEIAWGQDFIAEAPVVIVVFVDESRSKARYGKRGEFYSVCDGSASVENILIAATDLGLGSCWVGAFDDEALKKFFNTDLKPIAIIPIGYEG